MFKQWSHYQLLISFVILVFITTACFRDSAEGVGAQPVSQLIPTDIPTEMPTEVEITEDVEVTEDIAIGGSESTETPTATPTLTVTPSTTPSPTATVPVATETMTIDPLFLRLTQTEEANEIVNIGNTVPGGTAVAQVPTEDALPDGFALTSTEVIQQVTRTAESRETQAAIEAGLGVTETPLFPTVDPLLPATPIPQPQGGVPGQDCVHQIRVGETLFKLSLAYGVRVSDMQSASNIANPNLILVGQRVTIPSCGTTGFFPPPTSVPIPTATINAIGGADVQAQSAVTGAGNSTVTTNTLAAQAQQDILNNAQADIQANAIVQGAAPATGRTTYTVQQYDTLFQIAQANGTTVDAIAALNGITNINSITMGDVLQIP